MAEKIRISDQDLQELGKEAAARKIAEAEGKTRKELDTLKA